MANKLLVTPGCRKYDKTEVGGLNMLIAKDSEAVIVRTQALMHKCLSCKFFPQKCEEFNKLVDFLDINDSPHDGI